MALFRRNRRRDDIYDDLDDPEAGPADSGDLNDAFEDDYEDEEPGGSIAGLVSKVLATVVVSGLFVGVLLYAYSWSVGQRSVGESEVPLVEAQPGPEKVKPEDPGGMNVPYQDQLVLNQGDGAAPGEVERLLPPPESPRPVEQGSATKERETPSGDGNAAQPRESQGPTQTQTQAGAPDTGASPDTPAGETSPPDADQIASTDTGRGADDGDSLAPEGQADQANAAADDDERIVPRPPGSKPTPPRDAAASEPEPQETAGRSTGTTDAGRTGTTAGQAAPGDVLIQLAAFQQRENAEAAWQRMQGRHARLLGTQALQLQRVRIEDKGVFWRVRTGPFPNRATAEDLCGQLKRRGQPCLVVRK